ncbi:MAG: Na/Pi cotransporter family protein [Deltaproteobacteria bacterium]|nr:Na/Pi cotransporter family protein [Deltaproteobacteria bacterium]
MAAETVFNLIGGLGLFFLGMKTMSDSLKKVAGDRLRNALHILTKQPIIGLFVGAIVTCLIQSSSATTVMSVGFVNAGLLTLKQAISIILGANIGTTVTAWLVSFFAVFKITSYALPAIGVGFFVTMLGKTRSTRMWGQFILGFGLLFTGLGFMKDAFVPWRESQALKDAFLTFGSHPILGILIGVVVTVLFQSSSATIALLQIMAFSGLIDFQTAIPIILGDNIGTTVTAELSAIGRNTNARRTARAHALLNIIGVCYMIAPVYTGAYGRLIELMVPGPVTTENIMLHIALSHTVFNVINSFFVFLPLIDVLEKLAIRLTRVKPGTVDIGPIYLEKHLLETPPLALEQTINEITRMIDIARDALRNAVKSFVDNDTKPFVRIREQEDAVDNLQKEITQYLVELSQKNLEKPEAEMIPVLLHSVNDVERVGDHAINILELSERKIDEKLPFTVSAIDELKEIVNIAFSMLENAITALRKHDVLSAERIIEAEGRLNELQVELKENHIQRLSNGTCNLLSGIVFIDFVDNMEKIGDHVTNIAEGVLRHLQWNMDITGHA